MAVVAGMRSDEVWGREAWSAELERGGDRLDRRILPIDGLFDLHLVVAPDGGFATPERPAASLTPAELAELVCRDGGQGCDVRVVAPTQEQNLATLIALAGLLERDVLIAPPGAGLTYAPTSAQPDATGSGARGGDEIRAVDLATGNPADWWTITPSGQIDSVATWFDLAGGRVRPRVGTVTLPLAGRGLMFPTQEDFVLRRTAAAGFRPGHPGILTVAVGVRAGAFLIGDYSGRSTRCDGNQLAAALATLPLYGANLRMWISWPQPPEERRALDRALTELAEVTGATVWAPAEGGRAELRGGCRDLSGIGPGGEPTGWQPYGLADSARFESDVDGRLVPVGGVAVSRSRGVSLVSVQPDRERDMATRYAELTPSPDAFVADLGVLADGRLALRYTDGSMLAAGGRQLRELLRQMGWRGSPIVLLSTITPEQADGAHRHAAVLGAEAGATVTFDAAHAPRRDRSVSAAGAQVQAPPQQGSPAVPPTSITAPRSYSRAAVARALAELDPDRPQDAQRLTAMSRALAEYLAGARLLDEIRTPADREKLISVLDEAAEVIEELARMPAVQAPVGGPGEPTLAPARSGGRHAAEADEEVDPVDADHDAADWIEDEPDGPDPSGLPGPILSSRFIDGPRLAPADRSAPPHHIGWLPPAPQTNSEDFDVYLECFDEPDDAKTLGVPSPHLFLLGHLDRGRLAARTPAGYLLQVRVAPGGAVDVSASEVAIPRPFTELLSHNDVYLLPAAWLSRCRIVSALRVSRAGNPPGSQRFPEATPVLLRCANAGHGVPGLPAESARWPNGSLRAAVTRFVMVNENSLPENSVTVNSSAGLGTWLQLFQHRPPPVSGHRLLEVRIARRTAINVAATASDVATLTSVRSVAGDLVARGVEFVLPTASYAGTIILHEYHFDSGRWRRTPSTGERRLDAWTPVPVP